MMTASPPVPLFLPADEAAALLRWLHVSAMGVACLGLQIGAWSSCEEATPLMTATGHASRSLAAAAIREGPRYLGSILDVKGSLVWTSTKSKANKGQGLETMEEIKAWADGTLVQVGNADWFTLTHFKAFEKPRNSSCES
eukprot:scaffold10863_cov22-Prasinocladus_malaysianus.AAC.6